MDNMPFRNRDISWLSFNYRVLQEAKDLSVPLFERLKFLAIYSNNLDEFFKVRVAHHRNLVRLGKKTKKKLQYNPKELLQQIRKIVNEQQEEYSDIFENQIVPELKNHDIHIKRRLELSNNQKKFVEAFFMENMLPFVQPVLLVKNKILPFLNNAALYLAVVLLDKDRTEINSNYEFAIVKIPSDHLGRFVVLPSNSAEHHVIMLDDIVRHSIQFIFPGYHIIDTYSVKLTRDAELYIDDEFSGNLIAKIRKSLGKRNVGPASRFVYDRTMPQHFLQFLRSSLQMKNDFDLFAEGRYHNNFDFFKFPTFGMHALENVKMPPIPYNPLEKANDFFSEILKKDHMVHFPYHSYESVVRFFEEAAIDPKVTHIKIVQYRVAKVSRIMNALIKAVKNGKQVSAFVEVKARFDEEANLNWGEKLEAAGVNVNYSFPGLKVHSKIALVRKVEDKEPMLYTYLSTGNFHEDTAKIYSDCGLFTCDTRLTNEVARVFSFLETVKLPQTNFQHLLVGQFNLKTTLIKLIDQEIELAKAGKPAKIILKMNSIEEKEMIAKLYEASEAGVQIDLIIRGICCIVPGIKGYSENINIISIVDRFLEHARVFYFQNGGKNHIYFSSADWMYRNLNTRIEVVFPVYDEELKIQVLEFLNIQLNDNTKARIIDKNDENRYHLDTSDLSIRSQFETYFLLKRSNV